MSRSRLIVAIAIAALWLLFLAASYARNEEVVGPLAIESVATDAARSAPLSPAARGCSDPV